MDQSNGDGNAARPPKDQRHPVRFFRSTKYNLIIYSICMFCCPGLWIGINSLGGGGAVTPHLVNKANCILFCTMVVSSAVGSTFTHVIGIRQTLILGCIGYTPYAAGLYLYLKSGAEWLMLFGCVTCGFSGGLFWTCQTTLAISYPEPWRRGRFFGIWLTSQLFGQVVAGAVSLGFNVRAGYAGKVSDAAFIIFITLTAASPFVAALLTPPAKVEREDGKRVSLKRAGGKWQSEIVECGKLLFDRRFLMMQPLLLLAYGAEAVYWAYLTFWFTVRARALDSFIGGVCCVINGNLMGPWLDRCQKSLRTKLMLTYVILVVTNGAWWIWMCVNVTNFRRDRPVYDWDSPGFGNAFAVNIVLTLNRQFMYMFSPFLITNISKDETTAVRFSGLVSGCLAGWQAIMYGLVSIQVMAEVGGAYMLLGAYVISVVPCYILVRDIGRKQARRESAVVQAAEDSRQESGIDDSHEKPAPRSEGEKTPSVLLQTEMRKEERV